MSAYFQTHGCKHPGFVDADTLEILLDNEAAAEGLDLYKVAYVAALRGHMAQDTHSKGKAVQAPVGLAVVVLP